jgi:hypothetical protein
MAGYHPPPTEQQGALVQRRVLHAGVLQRKHPREHDHDSPKDGGEVLPNTHDTRNKGRESTTSLFSRRAPSRCTPAAPTLENCVRWKGGRGETRRCPTIIHRRHTSARMDDTFVLSCTGFSSSKNRPCTLRNTYTMTKGKHWLNISRRPPRPTQPSTTHRATQSPSQPRHPVIQPATQPPSHPATQPPTHPATLTANTFTK